MVRFFSLVILSAFLTSAAVAQTLTTQEAQRFVDAMPAVQELGAQYQDSFDRDLQPEKGEPFAPYSQGAAQLKADDAAAYRALSDVVADHGFDTVDQWAGVGDQVMAAYLALKTGDRRAELTEMRARLTPDMLSRLPAGMQRQMETAMAMLETVEQVPDAHIDAVRPVAGDLDDMVERGR